MIMTVSEDCELGPMVPIEPDAWHTKPTTR